MPVILEVSLQGQEKIARLMSKLDPKRDGVQWQRAALVDCGKLVQDIAARKKIKRSGRIGAKGRKSAPPLPNILTARHGGSGIVGSIRVNRGPLPSAVDVGSDLKYARVHELGGVFNIPRHRVNAHTRTVAFGRKVAPFSVGPFDRGPYRARFPKRPFLVPALDEAMPSFPDIFIRNIEKVLGART